MERNWIFFFFELKWNFRFFETARYFYKKKRRKVRNRCGINYHCREIWKEKEKKWATIIKKKKNLLSTYRLSEFFTTTTFKTNDSCNKIGKNNMGWQFWIGSSLILHLIDETAKARKLGGGGGQKNWLKNRLHWKPLSTKAAQLRRLDIALNLQQQLQRSVSLPWKTITRGTITSSDPVFVAGNFNELKTSSKPDPLPVFHLSSPLHLSRRIE